ncbi:MAG: sugar transferase [Deltaproteobacteria bacterium]
MKGIFDILLAIMLLVILCIPMFIVALLVRLTMGSPVLFVQRRPGLHGNPFFLYKYRTMNNAKDTSGNLLSDDVRLTFTGKTLRRFSLDELPQLFNVIKGDLSFVGPRPLLMQYLPRYSPEQARRHDVKPGITGWAQVNGRNAISWEEKFKLDVWYVDHRTFVLDMKILWMTFIKVFRQEGISAARCETMPEFMGSTKENE